MINQIEHNEVKSSQISENEVVGSKDSSGTIIHGLLKLCYFLISLSINYRYNFLLFSLPSTLLLSAKWNLFNLWNGMEKLNEFMGWLKGGKLVGYRPEAHLPRNQLISLKTFQFHSASLGNSWTNGKKPWKRRAAH